MSLAPAEDKPPRETGVGGRGGGGGGGLFRHDGVAICIPIQMLPSLGLMPLAPVSAPATA